MNKGIRRIFSEVPGTYELVNHVLTCGLDTLWRRKAARFAAADGGTRWLDICSGTGEMAVYLCRLAEDDTTIVAADFSLPMLRNLTDKSEATRIVFTIAEASTLPFHNNTFDLVTISFATRNINVSREALIQCLREFYRILKPGGRFVSLETSQPPLRLFRWLFHVYVRLFVKPIGFIISGSRAAYACLSHTIPRFYSAGEFGEIVRRAGFVKPTFKRLFFGVAAIHKAVK